MFPGDPNELVAIDMRFSDETFAVTEPLPRYMAQRALQAIAIFDDQPKPGARVTQAQLVPLVP